MGWELVIETGTVYDEAGGSVEAECSSGRKVLGGGFFDQENENESLIMFSRPNDDGTAWEVGTNSEGDGLLGDPISIKVYAICAMVQ